MNATFDEAYKQLNEQQKKAVDTIEGPVVVSAGPGTGKTQILALRIANILRIHGADTAENILALTFTNAGVRAMRERLISIIGIESAYRINIFTFHSLAEEYITSYPDYFPSYFGRTVIDEVEAIALVESIIRGRNDLKLLKTFGSDTHFTRSVISAISELKREGVSPDNFEQKIVEQEKALLADESSYYKRATAKYKKGDLKPDALKPAHKNKELLLVYRDYQDALIEKKKYDFSDTILSFIQATDDNPEFLSHLQEQFQYILVDEHQDTNDAQNQVITRIGSADHLEEKPNIFIVGDKKQAIFRFQGASVENFTDFAKTYSEHVAIRLDTNYRSTKNILDLTASINISDEEALIEGNKNRSGVSQKTTLVEAPDYESEIAHVVGDISQKVESGVDPNDIAIIYREHKHLGVITSALTQSGINYSVSARENILDNTEIKKLILMLRFLSDPSADDVLSQLLYSHFVDVPAFEVLTVLESYRRNRTVKTLVGYIKNQDAKSLGIPSAEILINFINQLEELVPTIEETDPVAAFESIIYSSGFVSHILSLDNNEPALSRLKKLFEQLRKEVDSHREYSLKQFIGYLETIDHYGLTIDMKSASGNGVRLLTVHGSKGLEFTHVYVVHVNDGVWGGKRSYKQFKLPTETAAGDVDDERRLFYVAMTRAETGLSISYSKIDNLGKERLPSRFIAELDQSMIETVTASEIENMGFSLQYHSAQKQSLLDPDYIRSQFYDMPLSVSALNNYFKSPLVYFFRSFLRLPSAQGKSLLFGNVVHKALELYFIEVFKSGKILDKSILIDYFDKALDASRVPNELYEELKKRGRTTLEDYYEKRSNEWLVEGETEAFIRAVPIELHDGNQLLLRGIIDKLEKLEDGTYRVVDYKTGKNWSEKSKEDKEYLVRQLVFYKLLLDGYAGGKYRMSEAVLDFVEKNKKGEYEQHVMQVTSADVSKLIDEINEFADDIAQAKFLNKLYLPDRNNKEYIDLLEMMKN